MPHDDPAHTFHDDAVAAMLAAQGYAVPPEDLTEIRLRLNDLIAHARSWDAHAPFDEEPWPQWPRDPAPRDPEPRDPAPRDPGSREHGRG